MADYQYGTGEGIAFSGKAQTFEGLRSRMLGIEHEKRKEQDKGIANLQDFNIGTGKYYPLIANKIAEEKMNFLNDLQKDIKQYGKTQAINRNWLKKQEVANRIKRYEMTNDLVTKAVSVDHKSFAPRAEKILSIFSNPNATKEEILSLNDPDAGVNIDENLNFSAYRFPKVNENDLLKGFQWEQFTKEVKDISGNIAAVEIGSRIPDAQVPIVKEYIAGDNDLLIQKFFQNEDEYRKKGINPLSQDDNVRMQSKEKIAEDIFNAKFSPRSKIITRGIPQEPQWKQKGVLIGDTYTSPRFSYSTVVEDETLPVNEELIAKLKKAGASDEQIAKYTDTNRKMRYAYVSLQRKDASENKPLKFPVAKIDGIPKGLVLADDGIRIIVQKTDKLGNIILSEDVSKIPYKGLDRQALEGEYEDLDMYVEAIYGKYFKKKQAEKVTDRKSAGATMKPTNKSASVKPTDTPASVKPTNKSASVKPTNKSASVKPTDTPASVDTAFIESLGGKVRRRTAK